MLVRRRALPKRSSLMKAPLISCLTALLLASTAAAGTTAKSAKSFKQPKNPIEPTVPCFADHELSIDTFASYQLGSGDYFEDAFGGGIALNCFWNRYFGFSLEGETPRIFINCTHPYQSRPLKSFRDCIEECDYHDKEGESLG